MCEFCEELSLKFDQMNQKLDRILLWVRMSEATYVTVDAVSNKTTGENKDAKTL